MKTLQPRRGACTERSRMCRRVCSIADDAPTERGGYSLFKVVI